MHFNTKNYLKSTCNHRQLSKPEVLRLILTFLAQREIFLLLTLHLWGTLREVRLLYIKYVFLLLTFFLFFKLEFVPPTYIVMLFSSCKYIFIITIYIIRVFFIEKTLYNKSHKNLFFFLKQIVSEKKMFSIYLSDVISYLFLYFKSVFEKI